MFDPRKKPIRIFSEEVKLINWNKNRIQYISYFMVYVVGCIKLTLISSKKGGKNFASRVKNFTKKLQNYVKFKIDSYERFNPLR